MRMGWFAHSLTLVRNWPEMRAWRPKLPALSSPYPIAGLPAFVLRGAWTVPWWYVLWVFYFLGTGNSSVLPQLHLSTSKYEKMAWMDGWMDGQIEGRKESSVLKVRKIYNFFKTHIPKRCYVREILFLFHDHEWLKINKNKRKAFPFWKKNSYFSSFK